MNKFTVSAIQWLQLLLEERFGHYFSLVEKKEKITLSYPGHNGVLVFDSLQNIFHQSRSDFPCHTWQASIEGYASAVADSIPAPSQSQLASPLIEHNEQGAIIHYDILGLTYWMLSRLEEVGRTDLDNHQRFPATSSHAYQHGYLERPIVDEWLHILGQVIRQVWPQLELKQHQFSMKVSHDVDRPSRYGFRKLIPMLRGMAGDLIKHRNPSSIFLAPWIRINTKQQLHPSDVFNTFDWLMDISESIGINSAFYFICGRTHPKHDADYEPEHPAIRSLMRNIHQRGHEIGLHPSYNAYQHPAIIKQEAERLKRICAEEGIYQKQWGGRMHYLRWEQPTTLNAWEQAGMDYDSTLGYADHPGFRCGTCHEYPAFNPVTQQQYQLRIRPLIAMECTIMADHYMGLGTGDAAYAKFQQLKESCRAVNGCFTLLWHNSQFQIKQEPDLYARLL